MKLPILIRRTSALTTWALHALGICIAFCSAASGSLPSNELQDDWRQLSAALANVKQPDWRDRDGYSIALLHLRYGSEERAVDFIRRAKPVNTWMEPRGTRLLNIAAGMGSQQAVKALLARGESPNSLSGNSYSPLMEAAWRGRLEVMRILIRAGADVNYFNSAGESAIMLALSAGYGRAARLLVDAGVDLDEYRASDRTKSLVFSAVDGGSEDGIRLLVEEGFDLSSPRLGGETVLTYAVAHAADIHLVELLLAYGADPCIANADGRTPELIVLEEDPKKEERKSEYGEMFSDKCGDR